MRIWCTRGLLLLLRGMWIRHSYSRLRDLLLRSVQLCLSCLLLRWVGGMRIIEARGSSVLCNSQPAVVPGVGGCTLGFLYNYCMCL